MDITYFGWIPVYDETVYIRILMAGKKNNFICINITFHAITIYLSLTTLLSKVLLDDGFKQTTVCNPLSLTFSFQCVWWDWFLLFCGLFGALVVSGVV